MITTTFGQLLDARAALERFDALPLRGKAARSFSKLMELVECELRIFAKQHDKLIEEYGTGRDATSNEMARGAKQKVHEVNPAKTSPEKMWAFVEAVRELREVPVELAREPVDGKAIFECGQPILPADMRAVGPLVTWPDDDSPEDTVKK